MVRRICVLVMATVLGGVAPVLGQNERQVRTFPEFVGTWSLDRAASTGPITGNTAVRLSIATTSTGITVTKVLDLPPEAPGREGRRQATNTPPPEVYRLDGTPTVRERGEYEYSYTFLLVADALALTERTQSWVRRGDPLMSDRAAFTMVTDAYSVNGDALTVHRQLTSVNGTGEIRVMQGPNGNSRRTYLYRRSPDAAN